MGTSGLQTLFDVAGWLQDLPSVCGNCDGTRLAPRTRWIRSRDGGVFRGYDVVCLDCGASLQFGSRREGGIYRKWDQDWYVPQPRQSQTNDAPSNGEGAPPQDQQGEDIPF